MPLPARSFHIGFVRKDNYFSFVESPHRTGYYPLTRAQREYNQSVARISLRRKAKYHFCVSKNITREANITSLARLFPVFVAGGDEKFAVGFKARFVASGNGFVGVFDGFRVAPDKVV